MLKCEGKDVYVSSKIIQSLPVIWFDMKNIYTSERGVPLKLETLNSDTSINIVFVTFKRHDIIFITIQIK